MSNYSDFPMLAIPVPQHMPARSEIAFCILCSAHLLWFKMLPNLHNSFSNSGVKSDACANKHKCNKWCSLVLFIF